ncbi:MAG: FadR family transcriptional regulator, partial [Chloroflexi bacterium]
MINGQSCDLSILRRVSKVESGARGEHMYIPIQSVKVFEQVAEQIEKRILDGELRSGDRLPTERELAEQFHVSRTAVREAMKILAQKGLVD